MGSLALVMMMVTGASVQAATARSDEWAVTTAEHQWLKSQQTNNVELLAPLLAERVVETDDGKVFMGKRAVLADAKSVAWSSVEYTDLKVMVFGYSRRHRHVRRQGNECRKPLNERVRLPDRG